ncbi:hypothetical protein [Mycobacterium sp.]|nr:hypothetical protein [Mycobacterium sp.]
MAARRAWRLDRLHVDGSEMGFLLACMSTTAVSATLDSCQLVIGCDV